MQTRAEICIQRGFIHEGGFVDHPHDPGGATNLGITLATFRRYIKPKGTVEDLKRLTIAQATIVYKRQYWDVANCDLLPIGLDYAVYDFVINSGASRAVKELQGLLGIPVDGKVGPVTIQASKVPPIEELIKRYCDERIKFMKVIRNKKTKKLLWETFGRGWARRVAEVQAKAIADTRLVTPKRKTFWQILADILKGNTK